MHSKGKFIKMFIEIHDHIEISQQVLLLHMDQLSQVKFIEKVGNIKTKTYNNIFLFSFKFQCLAETHSFQTWSCLKAS